MKKTLCPSDGHATLPEFFADVEVSYLCESMATLVNYVKREFPGNDREEIKKLWFAADIIDTFATVLDANSHIIQQSTDSLISK